ncbi:uncharacterized protein LOC129608964 [Condylostylus longicornis]|uniref:uncharacterized protein LOC129608964 n=1 Tax=Condylostylus longicornis TaxID=2530218 RepID=UPI00244DB735|nr:uncharacterized protein LOC129608964 [Condylostylus longicornis]
MCGIFAIFSKTGGPIGSKRYFKNFQSLREIAYQQSGKQRKHRGPDDTGLELIQDHGVCLVHERRGIVGFRTGHQPLVSADGTVLVVANGEIYNYLEQSAEIAKKRGRYDPKSDCSVIVELYEEYGEDLFDYLSGMYAFALYDKKTKNVMLARDPIGIIPLYYGYDKDGNLFAASEMKCLIGVCEKIENFPPGMMYYGKADKMEFKCHFKEKWITEIPKEPANLVMLKQKLESAVRTHLHCDVELGALLSGGVDSSLIASIATKIMREKDKNFKLRTFSVGLEGAPDFKYSKMVAEHIQSDHTELVFTVEEGLDCIRDIIYHLETYDITTVRCSIPMYLLTRRIKSENIRMILSGEGADELFGGYLYFFKAPTTEDFHKELVKRVLNLYHSDCLRANKVSMAWAVELRVPFLDRDFLNYVMSIRPEDKIPGDLNCYTDKKQHRIEKYILREAFSDEDYLPNTVLWRQKEQFSDGVGYNWIDTIKEYAASHITDEEFDMRTKLYPINTPETKEAFYYRQVFEEMFPGDYPAKTVMKWIPRTDWGCSSDPSGRAQASHQAHK